MRFIIFGVGAIGGGIAAALARTGHEVVGIARGAQLEAIGKRGLRLRTPDSDETIAFPCVAGPEEIDFRPDDAIFLTMKTQDTKSALEALARRGVRNQPLFCFQNGIENERLALRLFPNVHAVVVMMPAEYVTAGEVIVSCAPKLGVFNIGRYPAGSDAIDETVCEALSKAGFAAFPDTDVMPGKYGKLLLNLGNVIDAAVGPGGSKSDLAATARKEAEGILDMAKIACSKDYRQDHLMKIAPVAGVERKGSSSAQSLLRGTGSIETDYLNGEIVLLGRLLGVPTPVNAFLCDLGRRLIVENIAPGSLSAEAIARSFEGFAQA